MENAESDGPEHHSVLWEYERNQLDMIHTVMHDAMNVTAKKKAVNENLSNVISRNGKTVLPQIGHKEP